MAIHVPTFEQFTEARDFYGRILAKSEEEAKGEIQTFFAQHSEAHEKGFFREFLLNKLLMDSMDLIDEPQTPENNRMKTKMLNVRKYVYSITK